MLIRHTLKYLPAQVLSPLAQLVSIVLWTHWLAPAEMGVLTLVTVTQEVAYLVCLGWFAIYALRDLPPADDAAARGRYLRTENAVVLASIALSSAAALAVAWALPQAQATPGAVAVLAAFFATKGIATHYGERARAQSAFGTYTLLQVSGPLGGLLLGWLALQLSAPTATLLLAAYAAAQALGTLLALPSLGIRWRSARPDAAVLRAAAVYGGPVLLLAVLGWLAENYIRYLVQWHGGATALGMMVVGWSLGRRCASVAGMLVTTAAFPLAARLLNDGRRADALAQLRLNAALMAGVLLPVTVALQLLGPPLVALFVAAEYRAATGALLGLSVLAGALRNLHVHTTDQLMILDRRIAMVAWVDVVEIALCVGASLVGLRLGGVQGAVIGQGAGSLATLAFSVAWAQRRLGFDWPWLHTARIGAATVVMAAVLLSLPLPAGAAGLVGGALAGALAYGAACAVLFGRAGRVGRVRRR